MLSYIDRRHPVPSVSVCGLQRENDGHIRRVLVVTYKINIKIVSKRFANVLWYVKGSPPLSSSNKWQVEGRNETEKTFSVYLTRSRIRQLCKNDATLGTRSKK